MKYCAYCGQQMADTDMVCPRCAAAQVSQQQAPRQAPYQPPVYQQPYQPPMGEQPVSLGAWIGYLLVSGIPVVGLIVLLVLAFGSGTAGSLKNWARAQLIFMLIAVVLSFTLVGALFDIVGELHHPYY